MATFNDIHETICNITSAQEPLSKYRAEIGGASWSQGPVAFFDTIREARAWAEEYGTTADICVISNARNGVVVARHLRDTSKSHAARWYKGEVQS